MRVLVNEPVFEMEVKKSRFISYARFCPDLQCVKNLVKETRLLHEHASHVVHAAVTGKNGDLFSLSDDKEPKNTAGRPALEVVKGSDITNICILIVRYFGGTLLGTGGLVKAYGDSTKGVLFLARTEELVSKSAFTVEVAYTQYEMVKKLLLSQGCTIKNEDFKTTIIITGNIPSSLCQQVQSQLIKLTNAQAVISFTPIF